MIVVLNTLVDIYKQPTREGQVPKLVRRNVKCKKQFETQMFTVEQYIKPNGEISKQWCNVKDSDNNYYRIAHTFEYVEGLKETVYITGYKRWEK